MASLPYDDQGHSFRHSNEYLINYHPISFSYSNPDYSHRYLIWAYVEYYSGLFLQTTDVIIYNPGWLAMHEEKIRSDLFCLTQVSNYVQYVNPKTIFLFEISSGTTSKSAGWSAADFEAWVAPLSSKQVINPFVSTIKRKMNGRTNFICSNRDRISCREL